MFVAILFLLVFGCIKGKPLENVSKVQPGFNITQVENKTNESGLGDLCAGNCKQYCDKNKLNIDDYWKKGKIIHFIGKDIIYFHFLFWPAMLMDADFALPERIVVHGFLTVNKEKMSKSRGTFLLQKNF